MLKGIGASVGIGIGKAVVIKDIELDIKKRNIDNFEFELELFNKALEHTKQRSKAMAETLRKRVGSKEAEILEGHVLLMSDPMLIAEIETGIRTQMLNSEYVLEDVCERFAAIFESMDDELMQQRATDMRDIKTRLQKSVLGLEDVDLSELEADSILIAKDLTPSMTAGLDPEKVTGIITQFGGTTSHSAILARALEIPAILSVAEILDKASDKDPICMDGESGELYINPSQEIIEDFKKKQIEQIEFKKILETYKGKESVSKDGRKVEIAANIGKPGDVKKVLEYDADGIGLFRTEFLFMDRDSIPNEEEQFEAYKKVAVAMEDKPVIIRTLDIGGDKEIPYMNISKDENPFLGYRAIRLCLDRKDDIYRPQLRALLRASAFGNIKIMLPLITSIEEVYEAKQLIEEEKKNLDAQGIDYNKSIKVGVMIETAAATLIADILAKEVDFFSIGTNDLIQYTMSVDRGNDKVSYLYSVYNPAVLRAIKHIISEAKKAGIQVGMCGEAAADPKLIPLLLYWGLDEFSMSASYVLKSRKLVTDTDIQSLKDMEEAVMALESESKVRTFLEERCQYIQ
jgi:phosphoenolpyruvate-protein phosphotransferase